ncbi:hypothetical protein LXL04_009178 [Taraxacum kok-saghyz]
MDAAEDVFKESCTGIYEPFSGLNQMDFELHEQEFVTSLNKCKDSFLNVLLSEDNLRNSSLVDEFRAQVYHAADWQSDEEEVEGDIKKKYRIHDPNTRWDLMEPDGT